MRARRSHTEVVQEVLRLCAEQQIKTHIMHGANLSHGALEKYLAHLDERGLIERQHGAKQYQLTARGAELLGLLRRAHEILGEPDRLVGNSA